MAIVLFVFFLLTMYFIKEVKKIEDYYNQEILKHIEEASKI